MVEVRQYILPPTRLMPNSPLPLIHYVSLFHPDVTPSHVNDVLISNGWSSKWLVRYGPNQKSHYHSKAHEAMVVLSGSARILFGVADMYSDDRTDNYGDLGQEAGGIELDAKAGDVFVLPAGLAHKSYKPTPSLGFKRLSPGDGHDVTEEDMKTVMETVELSGFTMLGAYVKDGCDHDFLIGGENEGDYEAVWNVPVPEADPVLGRSQEGICSLWKKNHVFKL